MIAKNKRPPKADDTVEVVKRNPYDSVEDHSISLYIRDMVQTPLLTREEEKKLATQKIKGTNKQRAAAREKLITSNLRLVVKIAKGFQHRGLPLQDLINEGNIGLMKGVERYEPEDHNGASLATYAYWWIEQTITRAVARHSRTIRIPIHMVERIYKMNRVEAELTSDLGRPPTDAELAVELYATVSAIKELKRVSQYTVSLDLVVDENESTISDFIADPGQTADKVTCDAQMRERVRDFVDCLSEREQAVINMRFGIIDGNPLTLEQIGRGFRITKERVRQIEAKALKKLRKMMAKQEKGKQSFMEEAGEDRQTNILAINFR